MLDSCIFVDECWLGWPHVCYFFHLLFGEDLLKKTWWGWGILGNHQESKHPTPMEETSLHQATKTCGLAFSPIRLQIFANFPSKKITSPLKFGLYKCPQKRSKHIETRFTTKSQNFRFTIYQNSVSPNWIFLAPTALSHHPPAAPLPAPDVPPPTPPPFHLPHWNAPRGPWRSPAPAEDSEILRAPKNAWTAGLKLSLSCLFKTFQTENHQTLKKSLNQIKLMLSLET